MRMRLNGQPYYSTVNLRTVLPAGLRRWIKVIRARAFEALGSDRYSWPALNDLDRKLAGILPASGTYLEIGAADGYTQSNTYFLERIRGWTGILVEPVPRQQRACRRLRRNSYCVNVACVASNEVGSVAMAEQRLMSVVLDRPVSRPGTRVSARKHVFHVNAATLSAVIDGSPYSGVDFISIDVEGAELDVLAGLDLSRHAPRWLLVETDHIDEVARRCEPWGLHLHSQLTHHDYLFAQS